MVHCEYTSILHNLFPIHERILAVHLRILFTVSFLTNLPIENREKNLFYCSIFTSQKTGFKYQTETCVE